MMLDAHPELAIPSETHFIPELIDSFDERRRSPDEVLEMLRSHRRWEDFHLDADELLARLREREPLDAGESLRAFFGLYAAEPGRQAALGRQDPGVRRVDAADLEGAAARRASST